VVLIQGAKAVPNIEFAKVFFERSSKRFLRYLEYSGHDFLDPLTPKFVSDHGISD
jgi:hypothetical protein